MFTELLVVFKSKMSLCTIWDTLTILDKITEQVEMFVIYKNDNFAFYFNICISYMVTNVLCGLLREYLLEYFGTFVVL